MSDKDLHLPSGTLRASETARNLRVIIDQQLTFDAHAHACSKLLTSLGDMKRGHIADSMFLLNILNDVYSKHVNCLVTGLTTQLEDCASLSAEVHVITIRAQSTVISQKENDRLRLLRDCLEYLNMTVDDFDSVLNAEARKSSHPWHYVANPLRIDDCYVLFRTVRDSLVTQLDWLDSFIPTTVTIAEVKSTVYQ